jgi:nicotinate-nucleotide adenylyltransferase
MNKPQKKRVGVLGGSFDPVHKGHIGLATGARDKFQLDSVLFIPAYLSPHKLDCAPAPAQHRLAMLEIALSPHPSFSISGVELLKKGVSFTVDTLAHLTALHPDTDFFLIMGIDAFMGLKTWKSAHRLLEMCYVIVATRPGYPQNGIEDCLKNLFFAQEGAYSPATLEGDVTVFHHPEQNTTINFFDLQPEDIASRDIRDRTHRRLEIKNMLPPEVENYMIANQLYL